MRNAGKVLLAVTLLLAGAGSVGADVVAIQRAGTTVYPGPNLSSVFQNAISGGTITLYTDASSGQDMVDDCYLYNANVTTRYSNYGASAVEGESIPCLFRFNLSVLPYFLGGRVKKAELQLYFTHGNSGPGVGEVLTQDWAEGNKTGGFPGAAPALVGASYAHPRGLNTGTNQNPDGGTSAPLATWGVIGDSLFSALGDAGMLYRGPSAPTTAVRSIPAGVLRAMATAGTM